MYNAAVIGLLALQATISDAPPTHAVFVKPNSISIGFGENFPYAHPLIAPSPSVNYEHRFDTRWRISLSATRNSANASLVFKVGQW